jgi:hypothetical protein
LFWTSPFSAADNPALAFIRREALGFTSMNLGTFDWRDTGDGFEVDFKMPVFEEAGFDQRQKPAVVLTIAAKRRTARDDAGGRGTKTPAFGRIRPNLADVLQDFMDDAFRKFLAGIDEELEKASSKRASPTEITRDTIEETLSRLVARIGSEFDQFGAKGFLWPMIEPFLSDEVWAETGAKLLNPDSKHDAEAMDDVSRFMEAYMARVTERLHKPLTGSGDDEEDQTWRLNFVTLQQFRDAQNPKSAYYQALLTYDFVFANPELWSVEVLESATLKVRPIDSINDHTTGLRLGREHEMTAQFAVCFKCNAVSHNIQRIFVGPPVQPDQPLSPTERLFKDMRRIWRWWNT